MIVRKRKIVTIEVEVEVAAEWSGESGGGKPPERWIESRNWSIRNPTGLSNGGYVDSLIEAAVYDIPEDELAE